MANASQLVLANGSALVVWHGRALGSICAAMCDALKKCWAGLMLGAQKTMTRGAVNEDPPKCAGSVLVHDMALKPWALTRH